MVLAIAPNALDDLLGTGYPGWVRVVGLALLPFALSVAWLSTVEQQRLRLFTPAVVAGDLGWVAASIATIVFGWYSAGGAVAVGVMALVVDVYAGLQWWAWRSLRSITE